MQACTASDIPSIIIHIHGAIHTKPTQPPPTPAPTKRNAPAMPKIEDEDFVVVCVVAGARASVE